MTLLLDANLSYRLLPKLREIFPGATHVREHGLQAATDDEIWTFAAANDLVIVTRDADFIERSVVRLLRDEPKTPKVIRLNIGNVSTADVSDYLIAAVPLIEALLEDAEQAHIELWRK